MGWDLLIGRLSRGHRLTVAWTTCVCDALEHLIERFATVVLAEHLLGGQNYRDACFSIWVKATLLANEFKQHRHRLPRLNIESPPFIAAQGGTSHRQSVPRRGSFQ